MIKTDTLTSDNKIPIIFYHSVGPINKNWGKSYLTLELRYLEDQFKYISKNFNIISLYDYWQIANDIKPLVKKALVITFDDGFLDNWIWGFPLLKKYGLKATIFVSTEFVDQKNGVRPNMDDYLKGRIKLNELSRWGYLSWEEMRIMIESGFVDIESHTVTHTKYPVTDRLIGFHHQESDSFYSICNLFPEKKPYYINDPTFFRSIDYGYPIFEESSAVIARKKIINDDFITECIERLSDYNFNNYSFSSAFKEINELYIKYKSQNILVQDTETENEYLNRLTYEISGSKKIIEENLQTKVKFLCWPNGDNTQMTHEIAINSGYLATTVGSKQKLPDSPDRIPLRIGLYHSRNNRFLSMFKVKYKIGNYMGLFPYKQVHTFYNMIKYGQR